MTAGVFGEVSADGGHIVVIASGDAHEVKQAAVAMQKMTPLFSPSDPPGALIGPLTWAAVTQLGHTFSGNSLGKWVPGPRLTEWITAELLRRAGAGQPEPEPLKLPEGLVPRPYQEDAARQIGTGGKFLLFDDPGPQPVSTPIWTPDGWKPLGKLVPGDVVYDSEGRPAVIRMVKDFGVQPVYQVTFSDRTSTLATAQHRWHVWTGNDRKRDTGGRVMSTAELMRAGLKYGWGAAKFYLPQQPVLHAAREPEDLPLDPYAYGALLGDGSLGITALSIACPDNEVLLRVTRAAADLGTTWKWNTPANRCQNLVFRRDGKLAAVLESLGARELSRNKHIDDRYLHAGPFTRHMLLAGLLDTDGCVSNAAGIEYSSASPRLASDVAWLARSLGAVVTESSPQPAGYRDKNEQRVECLDRHRVHARFPADGLNPFCLPRKAGEWARQAATVQRRRPPRTFQSIEPAGSEEVCCIGLDDSSTHVYLTDTALIPTHNTGKTVSAVLGMLRRQAAGHEVFPMVIVVPSWDVGDVWARHVQAWAPSWPRPNMYGGKDRRLGWGGIAITTYATARLDAASVKGPLARLKARAVIADEVHYAKNENSQQSLALRRIAEHAGTFIGLSGTPVTRDTGDIYPTLAAMDPDSWPSRSRMVKRYLMTTDDGYGEEIEGLSPVTEPEFRAVIMGQHRRVSKADVLAQLPPKVYSTRRVELPPEWRRAYDGMAAQMLAELPDGEELEVMSVLAQLTRLSQLASSAADVEVVIEHDEETGEDKKRFEVTLRSPSWKVDALLEVLAERKGQQVVVFTVSRQLADITRAACEAAGYRCGAITGAQGKRARQEDIDAFQDGKLDVMIATAGAGSLGITLTAAGTAVFLQRSWQMDQALQAEDRLHRIGQEHDSVEIIDIIARDTVDDRVRELLREKAGQLSQLVQDPRVVKNLLGGLR